MPALLVCGKPTCLGGDDLQVFTLLASILRFIQLVVLVPLTAQTFSNSDFLVPEEDGGGGGCPKEYQKYPRLIENSRFFIIAYISTSFVLAFLGLAIEGGIWCNTNKGTPTQPELRWKLKPLCLAVYLLLGDYCGSCDTSQLTTEAIDALRTTCKSITLVRNWLAILWATHLIELVAVGSYALYFLCKSKPRLPDLCSAQTRWMVCCQCCCTISTLLTCCLAGGRDSSARDFADVALVLTDLFDDAGILDLVLSDIIVGLRMLAGVQRSRQLECRKKVIQRCSAVRLSIVKSQNDEEMGEINYSHLLEAAEEDETKHDDQIDSEKPDGNNFVDNAMDQFDPEIVELVLRDIDESDGNKLDQITKLALSTLKDENVEPETQNRKRSVVYQLHRQEGKLSFRPTEREILSRKNADDRLAIAEGARFMRFAHGAYITQFTYSGLGCWRSMNNEMLGDRIDQTRILALTGLEKAEVVYAHFQGGVVQTPYSIVIDHAWRSVVVSIRGTDSLDDVVADMTVRPASLSEMGIRCGFDGSEYYVHAGMLRCAEWVYNDLERHGFLDKLLLQEDSRVAGYQLRLTGHSLGAGISSILSFFLKNKFPNLKCSSFSPPGCTVSLNVAERIKDFVTSYVLDTDIVPRLTLDAFRNLRGDIAEMVARMKVTKQVGMTAKQIPGEERRLLHRQNSIPPSKLCEQLDALYDHHSLKKVEGSSLSIPLYPPGNIVQLVKMRDDEPVKRSWFSCCKHDDNLVSQPERLPCAARWAHRDDFAEIIISSSFLDDHRTANVLSELERVAGLFGLSPPFTVRDAEK